jgi:S-(hydroxymethyl)glutathione dehydrogenase/alcohol dehydrogenase
MEAAGPLIEDLTWGRGADVAVLTVDTIDEDSVQLAMNLVGKRGRVIPVAAANTKGIKLDFLNLGMWEKQIRGTCFGSANPQFDIPRLLDRYLAGQLQLDEMITRTYSLDEINEGYEDLLNGKNIRGLLVFE